MINFDIINVTRKVVLKMAIIDEIKQRILQLDPGSFQSMCDSYLSKIGYPNIVSLGTQAGTRKTTRGTPDTYFFDANGKYVFVEYTTQQRDLSTKIKVDIQKCLDVATTQIPHEKISEIIYCHTSSNIAPKDDAAFRTMCEAVGIQFSIYGIDQLAQDLYIKYRGIAKDYLHVSVDTNQIESIEDFIKHYDASKLAAPLSTQFLFREDMLEFIDKLFEKTNIVILTGPAGTGKTRLALQYAEIYANTTDSTLLCIHDNALPLYEDLALYMEKPGQYILVIDDANQLSGLQHVAQYAIKQSEGYHVKILITVRDYAISKVKEEIGGITSFEIQPITLLTDVEIQQLIKQELGIQNMNYLSRITHLAAGNARIAMLAGKLAGETNRLDSIDDITELYSVYYNSALVEANIENDRQLLVTAGLIAFLRTLHIDRVGTLDSVFAQCKLTKEIFVEKLYELHKLEIVDICNDKAVCFSEQCLANYILKYVYCDKKLISLRAMIRACFAVYEERTLFAVNTLLGVYHIDELHTFVSKEIKAVWEELSMENNPTFFKYVKAFYPVNPIETLIMIREIIDSEEAVCIPIENLNIDVNTSLRTIQNDVLNILGGFADTENLETALDLFFEFYRKRPDLFSECYHAITTYYSISKYSYKYGYYTQVKLIEKFKEYSCNWTDDYVSALFLSIAPKLLGLHFDGVESERRNTATFYSFSLTLTEGVQTYRTMIWEVLYLLCAESKYQLSIYNLLNKYGRTFDESSREVINVDASYIVSIMELAFPTYYLSNCLLAERLNVILSTDKVRFHSLDAYLNTPKLAIYRLMKGPKHSLDIHYDEREKLKKDAIDKYVYGCSTEEFIELIDTCKECAEYDSDNDYDVSNGLELAFLALSSKGECFIKAIQYYLQSNTPFNIRPLPILKNVFKIMEPVEILKLLNSVEYVNKDSWMYAYYHEIPAELIDEIQLTGLYSFLECTLDASLTNSSYRNIDFLEKYRKVDSNVLIKASRIILAKTSYSRFVPHLYFSLLFNCYHNSPESVVKKFENDLELLEDIYIETISYSHHDDYKGQFLKAIFQSSPTILDKYIKRILCTTKSTNFDKYKDKNLIFFDMDCSNQIFDTIINSLIESSNHLVYNVSDFIESIVIPRKKDESRAEKQDEWIRHFITENFAYKDKMKYLFYGIANLSTERKISYIKLFLDHNTNYEMFESLPLFPLTNSWTDSAVPYLTSRIKYMEQILPCLSGLKFINHKRYIERIINSLREEIRQEEIRDILYK